MNSPPAYSGRKVFLNLLSSLAGSGAGMVSLAVCMHLLGAEGVRIRGVIAFSAAMVGFASLLTETGFTNAHVKRVSEGKDLARCVGTYGAIRILQSLLLAGLFAPVVLSETVFRAVAGDDPAAGAGRVERMVLAVTVLSVVLNQVGDIWRQTYAARRDVVHQRFPVVLGSWLQVPAAIFACGVLPVSEKTPLWWALANLVSPAVTLAYYLFWTKRLPAALPTRESFRSYSRFAAPMTVSGAFLSIQLHFDKWFLKRWAGYDAVGLYELCQKVVQTLDRQILAQMGNLVLSKMSELAAVGKRAEIGALAHLTERYLSFVAVLPTVVMAAAAAPVLTLLYGAPAAGGADAFAVLAFCGLVGALNRPYVQVIAGMDRPGYFAFFGGAMAVLDVLLNVVFIPRTFAGLPMLGLGITGAAVSTLLVGLAGTVLNRRAASALAGMGPVFRSWRRHAAAGGLAILSGAWVARMAGGAGPGASSALWTLAASAGAAAAAYVAAILVSRELGTEDLRLFRQAVSLRGAGAHALSALKER